jgi:hypothetical protein
MGFAEETCITVRCDGGCRHGGWDEGGPFHFPSRDKAAQWLRDHGWIVSDRVLCEGCAARAECEATGHRYPDQWLTFDRKGVQWRERYCDHCMQVEHDPPFEQLKVLSDAAQVLDGVQLEGGES